MRVVNTSRIPQSLTLTQLESGAETQLVLQPGVQELPDGYVISDITKEQCRAFLSLVNDEDDSVVSLDRFTSVPTEGSDTVNDPESESQAKDDSVTEDSDEEYEEDEEVEGDEGEDE